MKLFEREVKVSVEKVADKIRINSSLNDTYHEMKVRLLVDPETMEIKDINAAMGRVPYQICQKAKEGVKSLIGLRIEPGINRRVGELIGGTKGCVHLFGLLQESFKGAVQGRLSLATENLSEDEVISKLEELLKGACLRYTDEHRNTRFCGNKN